MYHKATSDKLMVPIQMPERVWTSYVIDTAARYCIVLKHTPKRINSVNGLFDPTLLKPEFIFLSESATQVAHSRLWILLPILLDKSVQVSVRYFAVGTSGDAIFT